MLTKRQKSQITVLRNEGVGYGTIAQRMQLPKSTVSSFCLRKAMTEKETDREKKTVVIPKVEEKEVCSKRKRIVCTVTVTFGA